MQNSNTRDFTDNRYFSRWEVERRLLFYQGPYPKHNTPPQEAKTIDLSCSGVRIWTSEEILKGQKIRMILFFSIESYINLTGDVCWVKSNDHLYKQAGIQFYNTPENSKDIILDEAFNVDRNKVVESWFKGWMN